MERRVVIRLCAAAAASAFVLPAAARAQTAETVTLDVEPRVATYGTAVRLTGTVAPAAAKRVEVRRRTASGWRPFAAGDSAANGSYALAGTARLPGELVARTDAAESAPVRLRIRPRLSARLDGPRVLGARLELRGRLRPASAGVLRLTVYGRTRKLALAPDGRFATGVTARRTGRVEVTLAVAPASGFVRRRLTLTPRIGVPVLQVGSRGEAVRFLEGRLRELRYAFRGLDRAFTTTTRDAVYAFQKVEGLSVTGVVGRQVWRELRGARTPRAVVPRGRRVEVDKGRQVLFEVRKGRVRKIVHVSTGATGNTPVGRWRIYLKTPGLNSLGMYYSSYFLRGFALHGYASVPTYPASHGCVRVPMWYAPGLYWRWPVGSVVRVLP